MRSVQVALRSRRRQYQVRDLVRQLASLNQTLEQRVAQRTAEAVERAQKLRLLSSELSLAEERERRRIAQVLHDDLQQMLMAVPAAPSHLEQDRKRGQAQRNHKNHSEYAGALVQFNTITQRRTFSSRPARPRSGRSAGMARLSSKKKPRRESFRRCQFFGEPKGHRCPCFPLPGGARTFAQCSQARCEQPSAHCDEGSRIEQTPRHRLRSRSGLRSGQVRSTRNPTRRAWSLQHSRTHGQFRR